MDTKIYALFVSVGCQPHGLARNRGKRSSTSDSQGEAQRDRRPNWSLTEMIALVDAKREEFVDEHDAIDGRDLMDSEVTKWKRISD